MKRLLPILLSALTLLALTQTRADVATTKTFTDNAVLQRDMPVRVWGTAETGEKITVSFGEQSKETTANENGEWSIFLDPMPASSEGKELVISGKNTLTYQNVVVGEVWICSGQSNMEMPLNSWGQPRLACTEEEISGDYSFIRFNRAEHQIADEPRDTLVTPGWLLCKDGIQKDCTATGFHFAVRLHQELGCPIGLIDSNWGGSNINSWIPATGWKKVPELIPIREQYEADLNSGKEIGDWAKQAGMFNAMLQPWVPYTIRGAIWYQGETNAGEGEFYFFKQKAMIEEWRHLWGEGDFPFYWVQLAPFTQPSIRPDITGSWPGLRDGQSKCLELPNTGQAVIIDVGETQDIHPRDKFDVGNRLALWALANIFGQEIEPQSPTFESVQFEGGKAIIKFSHVGSGLMTGIKNGREPLVETPNTSPLRFALGEIAPKNDKNDEDQILWIFADAEIVGKDTVVLRSPYVKDPSAVRYAWQMNPEGCNLYSREGLPATPFRTDK